MCRSPCVKHGSADVLGQGDWQHRGSSILTGHGPAAEAVANNVKAIREPRGLSQQQLALQLGWLGRPMQTSAVATVESGDRRVDVDDLTALAVALNVPVARLLLPDVDDDEAEVHDVPAYSVPMWSAWAWATGELSLASPYDEGWRDQEMQRRDLDFIAERPVRLWIQEMGGTMRATRHLLWAVSRTLANLPGTPRGKMSRQPAAWGSSAASQSGAGTGRWS